MASFIYFMKFLLLTLFCKKKIDQCIYQFMEKVYKELKYGQGFAGNKFAALPAYLVYVSRY